MLLKNLVAAALGGAAGTLLRFGISAWALPPGYPFGTIAVNLTGSFLLGFLTAWFAVKQVSSWIKSGAGAGFCGGFTTMSALASDTLMLAAADPYAPVIYLAISVFGGLLSALIGAAAGAVFADKRKKRRSAS